MLRMTIKETLASTDWIQAENYQIYRIGEDDITFYIGLSRNTYNRLLSHMGMDGQHSASTIGQLIIDQSPHSNSWFFEQYTLEDCREITLAFRKTTFLCQQSPHFLTVPLWAEETEEAMIKYYRPCLNVAANPNPTQLPEKYTHVRPNASSSQYISI